MVKQYLHILAEIVKKNHGDREIGIYGLGEKVEELKRLLKERNCMVQTAGKQIEVLEQLKQNLYVVIIGGGGYGAEELLEFNESGYIEIKDFLCEQIKPFSIKLCRHYKDDYGNEITNVPRNLEITIKGYGNRIRFGNVVKIGTGSTMSIENNCEAEIENYCKFGMNTKICMKDGARMQIKEKCTFGENNFFPVNHAGVLSMGTDCMASRNIVFRVGDGHAIFDGESGARMNYPREENGRFTGESLVFGDHVWIGEQSYILPSEIGSRSVVGAGSVVKGKYSEGVVLGGNPARVLKEHIDWERSPLRMREINKRTNERESQ